MRKPWGEAFRRGKCKVCGRIRLLCINDTCREDCEGWGIGNCWKSH